MFFYQGYSCPVCEKPFSETDDIVTCPDCGAPHHRKCWKQETHCFYADKHHSPEQWSRENAKNTVKQPDKAPTPSQQPHICAHCGAVNAEYAEFCSRCGRELEAQDWTSQNQDSTFQKPFGNEYREYRPFTVPPMQNTSVNDETDLDGVNAGEMRTFVNRNTHYYLPRFNKICKKESCISWNWAAFLLTPYWLWYRKQYLYGSIVLLFEILQTVCTAFFLYGFLGASSVTTYTDLAALMQQNIGDPTFFKWELIILLCSVIQMLIRIFFGVVGNYLYFRIGKKRIQKLKENNAPAIEFAHVGGVSFLLGAGAYVILYLASTFANILFM